MGSSCSTAGSVRDERPSSYDGRHGEVADVYVRSRRVSAFFGVHHFIVCDVPSYDKWIVFEWMDDGRKFYACKSLYGQMCMYLGRFKVKDVYKAALQASNGRSYSSDYNCNIWTENVAYKLGKNITVHWNCSCVLK